MTGPVLVTGATGRLGRLVTARLLERGARVRMFTRRPEAACGLFADRVEIAAGGFADGASLRAALAGASALFLLSPIGERLAEDQIAASDAAAGAGVPRIVKISGSDWTIRPPGASISGEGHASVERHLRGLGVEHVSIRPNAWMQVALLATLRQAATGGVLSSRHGDALVSYVDARDIADVAVRQLLAPRLAEGPLVITGPHAVSSRDVAAILSRVLCRPIEVAESGGGAAPLPGDGFEHRAVVEFGTLIAAGRAATVTGVLPELLGRAPRTAEAFVEEHFAAEPALAG